MGTAPPALARRPALEPPRPGPTAGRTRPDAAGDVRIANPTSSASCSGAGRRGELIRFHASNALPWCRSTR